MDVKLEKIVDQKVVAINREMCARSVNASRVLKNSSLVVLRGKRSGRVYRKPFTKSATYRASAPGEAPAPRTGTLLRSWRPKTVIESASSSLSTTSFIETDVKYAPMLEDGTPTIAPRPYRDEIIERSLPEIRKIFKEP